MAKRDLNIELCRVARRALSGQVGVEWFEAKQSGGRLVTGKAPIFSEVS